MSNIKAELGKILIEVAMRQQTAKKRLEQFLSIVDPFERAGNVPEDIEQLERQASYMEKVRNG